MRIFNFFNYATDLDKFIYGFYIFQLFGLIEDPKKLFQLIYLKTKMLF